jgi:hypothetical protein
LPTTTVLDIACMLFEIVKQVCSDPSIIRGHFLAGSFPRAEEYPDIASNLLNSCHFMNPLLNLGRALSQAVSRRPITTETRIQFQASTYGIYGVLNDTGTGLSSVRPWQYHSTNAPYSYFIYLQLPLYNLKNS